MMAWFARQIMIIIAFLLLVSIPSLGIVRQIRDRYNISVVAVSFFEA